MNYFIEIPNAEFSDFLEFCKQHNIKQHTYFARMLNRKMIIFPDNDEGTRLIIQLKYGSRLEETYALPRV